MTEPCAGKHHRHAFILCQAGIDALSQGVTPTLKLEDRRPRIKVVFVASLTRVEQLKKFLPGHLGCVMVWGAARGKEGGRDKSLN